MKRDPITGEILEFYEVKLDNVGLTNKNSTSLNRAPGALSEGTRGNTSNYPFWPGGFPDPILDLPSNDNINFSKDLLTIPPGFSRGLEFHADGRTVLTQNSEKCDEAEQQHVLEETFDELSVVNLLPTIEKEQDILGKLYLLE